MGFLSVTPLLKREVVKRVEPRGPRTPRRLLEMRPLVKRMQKPEKGARKVALRMGGLPAPKMVRMKAEKVKGKGMQKLEKGERPEW